MNLKTLSQKNARNTHATESLQFIVSLPFLEYIQEKITLVLEQYFKYDSRSESTIESDTVLTIILSAHNFS